jgi:naphtho-gamma-pyrone polyketide synthase
MFTTPLEDGVEPVELILFGDLAGIFEDELRTLLHIREHEALQAFFERVAFALREELGHRPLPIQNLFPRFTTLIDLVARLGETDGTPVLRFFLMTVCQIAKFILWVSSPQSNLERECVADR